MGGGVAFFTLEGKRVEKKVRQALDVRGDDRFGVLDRFRQVLQNDPAGQVREALFKGRGLMARTAADVDEEGAFRGPALAFVIKGVEAEAFGLGAPLRLHEEVEAGAAGGVGVDEVEGDEVGLVGPLEDAVGAVGGVPVAGPGQVAGHFLKGRVAGLEVELDPGLDLGFGEVERVLIGGIGVFADFVDHAQCRQISQETIYAENQNTCGI